MMAEWGRRLGEVYPENIYNDIYKDMRVLALVKWGQRRGGEARGRDNGESWSRDVKLE